VRCNKKNGLYYPPVFNVKKTARPLALFFYLVHIIRDFQKDQANNLNYFAENLMRENGLNSQTLKEIAEGKKIDDGFRKLMKKYYSLAEHYRKKARTAMEKIEDCLEPRYKLSLEIIYSLYLQIFERIDIHKGSFTSAELTPLPKEVKERICLTILEQKI
jgi:phytoene/squalene synthetase